MNIIIVAFVMYFFGYFFGHRKGWQKGFNHGYDNGSWLGWLKGKREPNGSPPPFTSGSLPPYDGGLR